MGTVSPDRSAPPQLHAIDAFHCDVVLVLDSERLYAELSEHYRRAASPIEVRDACGCSESRGGAICCEPPRLHLR